MDSRGHLALVLRASFSCAVVSLQPWPKLKQLLDLPDEILNFVAETVENGTSLGALARTCRRLQDHAERFIYRSLIIEAISRRPRRAAVVSKLFVVTSAVATRGIEYIPWMLEKMNCLKNLLIQSP